MLTGWSIGRTALRQVLTKLIAEGAIEVHGRSSYRVPDRSVSTETPTDVEPWQIHGERTVYDNRWVKLSLVDVEPPGVERFEHHVVRLHHVAIAAVLDDQDRVLMLWRYRFVPDSFGWELPGGIVDEGEDAAQAALRAPRRADPSQTVRSAGRKSGWLRPLPTCPVVSTSIPGLPGRLSSSTRNAGSPGRRPT